MINTSRSWNIFRCVIRSSDVTLECLLEIFFLDSWFFIWSFSLKQYINIKITIKGYQNYKARERRPWSRLAIIIICPVFYPPRQITSYCPHQKTSFIDNFDKTSWGLLISDPRTVHWESELGPDTGQVTWLSCDNIWYLPPVYSPDPVIMRQCEAMSENV